MPTWLLVIGNSRGKLTSLDLSSPKPPAMPTRAYRLMRILTETRKMSDSYWTVVFYLTSTLLTLPSFWRREAWSGENSSNPRVLLALAHNTPQLLMHADILRGGELFSQGGFSCIEVNKVSLLYFFC